MNCKVQWMASCGPLTVQTLLKWKGLSHREWSPKTWETPTTKSWIWYTKTVGFKYFMFIFLPTIVLLTCFHLICPRFVGTAILSEQNRGLEAGLHYSVDPFSRQKIVSILNHIIIITWKWGVRKLSPLLIIKQGVKKEFSKQYVMKLPLSIIIFNDQSSLKV